MNFSNRQYKHLPEYKVTENLKLVSIVLATYNGEAFLAQQLNSLFKQTYANIEIIATDDGSTDNTINILREYAARHSNMKVVENEVNLGFIKNFEKGCNVSVGDFIAFCDQDDTWDLDKIKQLVEAIGEYPLIYSDSLVCDYNLQPTGKKISDVTVCKNFDSCLQYAVFARIYGHALLFKRSLFESATPFLDVIPHDWWLAYNATLHGGVRFLPKTLVNYRQHSSNLFGIVGGKGKKNKQHKTQLKRQENEKARIRMRKFYDLCPNHLEKEKQVLYNLVKSYESFSLVNNFRRMFIFFRYHKLLLAVKKRSLIRQYLFCLKMFVTIK